MTEILCKWLNDDLGLSKKFDKNNFVHDFASGYYLGEVFNKYNLQNDFKSFSLSNAAGAKLNNFTRLEPTLALLQIPFDSNTAYSIMMKERGIVTRLLYQIYVTLQRLNKNKLTGTAIETMKASGPTNLNHVQSGLYKERLKTLVPRQVDINLQNVSEKFRVRKDEMERKILEEKYIAAEQQRKAIEEKRKEAEVINKEIELQRSRFLAKFDANKVQITKTSPSKENKTAQRRKDLKKKAEAEEMESEIRNFEKKIKTQLTASVKTESLCEQEEATNVRIRQKSSDEFIKKIKTRVEEDTIARDARSKRRRKVLMDQMKAHYHQQEVQRQEQIVQRLLKQSQQERRITVQLMQTRREKEILQKNRIFQEKQFEERRLKDYQDALDKEAELVKLMKIEYSEEIDREFELHKILMEGKRREKYEKNFAECKLLTENLLNFAMKIAEYRLITEKNVPDKLIREWKRLMIENKSLYKVSSDTTDTDNDEFEEEINSILDKQDFEEYHHTIGEWNIDDEVSQQLSNNNIFGHLLYRLFKIYQPPKIPNLLPELPKFPVKAAILGNKFSGKSTVVRRLTSEHRIVSICAEELLQEALQEAEDLDEMKSDDCLQENQQVEDIETLEEEHEEDEQENEKTKKETKDTSKLISTKARLGCIALEHLKSGRAVPDEVLVALVVERIKQLSDDYGYILDGFPATSNQAAILELALSGREFSPADGSVINRVVVKKSALVKDPKPAPTQQSAGPALHVVIILDVDDELVIKRALGRWVSKNNHEEYHTEFNPPPFGSLTGIAADQVETLEDVGFDKEQIQNRIISYHDNIKRLESFYRSASIVCHVNGNSESEAVFKDAELSLFEMLEMIQQMNQHNNVISLVESKEAEATNLPVSTPSPAPPVEVEVVEKVEKLVESFISTDLSSNLCRKSPKSSGRGRQKSAKNKKREKNSNSRSSSGKSKSRPSSSPEKYETATEAVAPPKSQPGDPNWSYIEDPIDLTLVNMLVPFWDRTENLYVATLQHIFRKTRKEREEILKYFYKIQMNFKDFLQRSDQKQPFVHSWQMDYNSFDEDLREDEEAKNEMHQRVEDLCERLWDICDSKKEENENERNQLMTSGWLEDHLCILTNLYIMMMQSELDRFQDTINVMRDYYTGIAGKVLSEVNSASNFLRLPIYDLSTESSKEGNNSQQVGNDATTTSSTSEVNKPSDLGNAAGVVDSRTKIPLIPRGNSISSQALEQETSKNRKAKTAAATSGTGNALDYSSSMTKQARDAEDKMLVEVSLFACNAVGNMVTSYIAEKEVEDNEEEKRKREESEGPQVQAKKGKKNDKNSAKGKKGNDKKSPKRNKSGKSKKGASSASDDQFLANSPPVFDPVAELRKKKIDQMKDEYIIGLRLEENRIKFRLDLIRDKGRAMLKYLNEQVSKTFEHMDQWIGQQYKQEMSAIHLLSDVARQYIEKNEPITEELRLEQNRNCLFNTQVKLVASPPPPPSSVPEEDICPDIFTISQLYFLLDYFYEINPDGLMAAKEFQNIISTSTSLSYEGNLFPSIWDSLSYSQMKNLLKILEVDPNTTVDWRKFLFIASDPPKPSIEELLDIRDDYIRADIAGNGWVLEDQYSKIRLWPFVKSLNKNDNFATKPSLFNREENLRKFYFQLFADHEQSPPRVNYINMLMYFAMNTDSVIGFFNALSVASGKPMPNVSTIKTPLKEGVLEGTSCIPQNTEMTPSEEELVKVSQNYSADKIGVDTIPPTLVLPYSWWLTLHYNSTQLSGQHRFSKSFQSIDPYSMNKILEIYAELNSLNGEALPIQVLMKNLVLQDVVLENKRFQIIDLKSVLNLPTAEDNGEKDDTFYPFKT